MSQSTPDPNTKPGKMPFDPYFMNIAMAVRKRANCLGNRVGAVITLDNRIVSTGYNGTPSGMPDCTDGGCLRCNNRGDFPSGMGYDLCICVHAEQNALLFAARFGIAVQGGVLYSTMRPCFGCTKEALQAGIKKVFYIHDWEYPDKTKQSEYERIQSHFIEGIHRLDMEDPDAEWAVSNLRKRVRTDETGHAEP